MSLTTTERIQDPLWLPIHALMTMGYCSAAHLGCNRRQRLPILPHFRAGCFNGSSYLTFCFFGETLLPRISFL